MCMICSLRNPEDALAGLDQHLAAGAPSAANPNDAVWAGRGLVTEGADAAAGVDTAYNLMVGQSAMGALSSGEDVDWFAITLQEGVSYEFRLLGYGTFFLNDTLLRLMDSSGTQIKLNDDGFTSGSSTHETDSALTFTATSSGTFYLAADNFSTETGQYLISATERDMNGMVFTVDEMAWQLINNGNAYFDSTEAAAFNVGADNTLSVDLTGLTADGLFLAQQALAVWTAYTGIQFQQVSVGAEITFDDSDTGAYAQAFTSLTTITSSMVNIGIDWLADFGTTLESYSFETYLHEIGHALGLGHGGNYNGSATYGTDNFYLNDSIAWTIMSYMQAENDEFDSGGTNDWNTYVDASFRYVYSPMIVDVIAMQQLYGVSGTAFIGDTTYGFGGNTGVAALDQAANSGALMAMTVYDKGGIDTLNFSNTTANQVISLAAESLSSVLGGRNNLGIARGVVVENANGGSGNDSLIGNSAGNRLNGGTGTDTLRGGAGDDIYITNGGDSIIEAANRGTDLVQSSVTLTLGNNLENLTLTGATAINGSGNTLGNVLRGNAGANRLDGKTGNDTLLGGNGADILIGGTGADKFVFNTALGAGNVDRILDFNLVDDVIQLENTVFLGLAAGALTAAAFKSNLTGAATDATDRITYDSDDGRLFYDADGLGGTARVLFATVTAGLALTHADFFVI